VYGREAAAQAVLGHEIVSSAEQFQRGMDPQHSVDVRSGMGGVAAAATAAILATCAEQITADQGWRHAATARLAAADAARDAAGARFLVVA
jgi:hypothetical protein